MEVKYYNEPWEHVVVDNFFPEDIYLEISNSKYQFKEFASFAFADSSQNNLYCMNGKFMSRGRILRKKHSSHPRFNIKDINKVFPELSESYLKWNSYFYSNDTFKNIFESLVSKCSFDDTTHMSGYQLQPKNYTHQIHDENIEKILSVVVYIGPEENNGTYLYEDFRQEYDNPSKIVEWKPNRAFIFSGKQNLTWHAFSANNTEDYRCTFAAFSYEKD